MSLLQTIGLVTLIILGIPVLLLSKPDAATLWALGLIVLGVALISAFMLGFLPEWRRRRAERQSLKKAKRHHPISSR